MHKIVYKLVYNRKHGLNLKGEALVQVEAYLQRRKKYFSTHVYLRPSQWDATRQRVRRHPNAEALNRHLHSLLQQMEQMELELCGRLGMVSLERLKAALADRQERESVACFVEREAARAPVRDSTRRNHLSTLRWLQRFRPGLAFAGLTAATVADFEQFLHAQGLHINTVGKHLKHLRRYVNLAVERGLLAGSPLRGYPIRNVPHRHTHLTPDELLRLERWAASADATTRMRSVTEAFLFCCYTGLRYSDFVRLTPEHFTSAGGHVWLAYHSQKTGTSVRIPVDLLAGGKGWRLWQGHRAHWPDFVGLKDNANVNKTLRLVAARAGVRKRVTFHTARHTCATLLIYKGVPLTTVQRLLGHKSLRTTQVYAHVMDATLVHDLERCG